MRQRPKLSLTQALNKPTFVWRGGFEDRLLAKSADFEHCLAQPGVWRTRDKYKALKLIDYADDSALKVLLPLEENVAASLEILAPSNRVISPEGCSYFPFQESGIVQASNRRISLLADDMGTGKTVMASGINNYLFFKKSLVIGPASLRLKWVRELLKWDINCDEAYAILYGNQELKKGATTVISYNLAVSMIDQLKSEHWDHLILDEAHYLNNPETARTMSILGRMDDNGDFKGGLIDNAEKVTLLTGTPITNRAHESFFMLRAVAPEVLGRKYINYGAYLQRFCKYYVGDHGIAVTGSKNDWELYNMLRGSGFMTRRLKKAVLPQLPEKLHSLVVFPADKTIMRIIEKEQPFDPEEIIKLGEGENSYPALPELRREMGEAKVPLVHEYVNMLLKTTNKVIIGAIHKNVVRALYEALIDHNPAVIVGATPPVKRQLEVDRFQDDESCRIFIGNLQAAGEGLDLTASSEVVISEPDWVPLKNNQFIDRSHRIGQTDKVNVHYLVVENSLDAYILSVALYKARDIDKILDGDIRENYN